MRVILWEPIDSIDGPDTIVRAKVPGGWIICISASERSETEGANGVTFVPDPNHTWDGNSLD